MPYHKQKQNLQGSASNTQSKIQQASHQLQTWKEELCGTEKTTKTNEIMKHIDKMQEILIDTKKLVCDVLTPCSLLKVTI